MFASAQRTVIQLLLITAIQCVSYLAYQPQKPASVCDNPSNAALVEHFFNLLFSEFHNSPPVCACVQMCADQPTYCYPNGCLRMNESTKKKDERVERPTSTETLTPSQGQPENSGFIGHAGLASFLVDDRTGYLNSFFGDGNFGGTKGRESSLVNGIQRPDPFKDKYKAIFKYKKTPKVHLRYNLREQVKNMKSDVIKIEKIDVSKTKWPTKGHYGKQFFIEGPEIPTANENSDQSNPSMHSDNPSPYSSRFFKRDLGKVKSKFEEKIAQKMDENQNVNSAEMHNNTFSLDNLIENLIESSFGPLQNDTELDLNVNVNLDYAFANNLTTEPITSNKGSLFNTNSIVIINETNVVSMNMSNEKTDKNKYNEETTEMYKNVYNEMIAKLAKSIEKQNNNSMEIMEMYLGRRNDEINDEKGNGTVETQVTTVTTTEAINTTFSSKVTATTELDSETTRTIDFKSESTPNETEFTSELPTEHTEDLQSSTVINEKEKGFTEREEPKTTTTDKYDTKNLNIYLKRRQKINKRHQTSKVKVDLHN